MYFSSSRLLQVVISGSSDVNARRVGAVWHLADVSTGYDTGHWLAHHVHASWTRIQFSANCRHVIWALGRRVLVRRALVVCLA